MIIKPKPWYPKTGDLVAIPELGAIPAGVRQHSSYGIVVKSSVLLKRCAVYFDGTIKWFDTIILMPLWSTDGTWLQFGK